MSNSIGTKLKPDHVTLESLALEIAKPLALAARTREGWEEADAMSQTISTTLHKIGMPDEGLPGVRPHILKMLEEGKIAVRSARNGLPPVQVSDVTASNFEMWYLTPEDADKVRAHLMLSDAPGAIVVTRKRQRQDALAVQLDEILASTTNHKPANVMAELRKQIGKPNTCILRNVGDGIEWENDHGDVKTLRIRALRERIKEWKKTGLSQG